jgi:hypothetical protein
MAVKTYALLCCYIAACPLLFSLLPGLSLLWLVALGVLFGVAGCRMGDLNTNRTGPSSVGKRTRRTAPSPGRGSQVATNRSRRGT